MAEKKYKSFQDIPKQQAYISPSTVPKKSNIDWHEKYQYWKKRTIELEKEIKEVKQGQKWRWANTYDAYYVNQLIGEHEKQLESFTEKNKQLEYYIAELQSRLYPAESFIRVANSYIDKHAVEQQLVGDVNGAWIPNIDVLPHNAVVNETSEYLKSKSEYDKAIYAAELEFSAVEHESKLKQFRARGKLAKIKSDWEIRITQFMRIEDAKRGIEAEAEAIKLIQDAGVIPWTEQSDRTNWPSVKHGIDRCALDLWLPEFNGVVNAAVDIKHHRTKALWGRNYLQRVACGENPLPYNYGFKLEKRKYDNYINYLENRDGVDNAFLWWIKPYEKLKKVRDGYYNFNVYSNHKQDNEVYSIHTLPYDELVIDLRKIQQLIGNDELVINEHDGSDGSDPYTFIEIPTSLFTSVVNQPWSLLEQRHGLIQLFNLKV